jgi:hypothetical protein
MSDSTATSMTLEERRVVLRGPAIGEVVVAVGIETVASQFRHAPPTGAEIEAAIDEIEDALMATRLGQSRRGLLTSASTGLQSLPGLENAGAVLSLDEVESLFQRLAAAASGPRSVLGPLPADRETAAALLILRETMHHLGFDQVRMTNAD